MKPRLEQPAQTGPANTMMTVVRAVLPPLLARYALRFLRVLMATPAVRALGLVVLGIVAAILVVPAGLAGMLVYLATQNGTEAGWAAVLVLGFAAAAMIVALGYLWIRWRQWRIQNIG